MVRIYSTRKILFRGQNENFIVEPHKITDAPDWVAKTDTYKMAIKGKDRWVNVLDNKKDVIAAQNGELEDAKNTENEEV